MAFPELRSGRRPEPLADINMIPLIDVMLVLMIVFMVTAPLLTHRVGLELPRANSLAAPPERDAIRLEIAADGTLRWDSTPLSDPELASRLAQAGTAEPVPELYVHADRRVSYGRVAETIALAARSGVHRIGFVSEPDSSPQEKTDASANERE